MSFSFKRLEIPDLILIQPEVFTDKRGFFMETYKYSDFAQSGIKERFVQDNHSKSIKRGVLRGLHYQVRPFAQAKLIRVVSGEIFDVAVDIRTGSPYYGRWLGVTLSSENKKMLYIPSGFAHGFCVLSNTADVIYKCTNVYSPSCERGIIWNDSTLNINWPIKSPILSRKDASYSDFSKVSGDFVYGT